MNGRCRSGIKEGNSERGSSSFSTSGACRCILVAWDGICPWSVIQIRRPDTRETVGLAYPLLSQLSIREWRVVCRMVDPGRRLPIACIPVIRGETKPTAKPSGAPPACAEAGARRPGARSCMSGCPMRRRAASAPLLRSLAAHRRRCKAPLALPHAPGPAVTLSRRRECARRSGPKPVGRRPSRPPAPAPLLPRCAPGTGASGRPHHRSPSAAACAPRDTPPQAAPPAAATAPRSGGRAGEPPRLAPRDPPWPAPASATGGRARPAHLPARSGSRLGYPSRAHTAGRPTRPAGRPAAGPAGATSGRDAGTALPLLRRRRRRHRPRLRRRAPRAGGRAGGRAGDVRAGRDAGSVAVTAGGTAASESRAGAGSARARARHGPPWAGPERSDSTRRGAAAASSRRRRRATAWQPSHDPRSPPARPPPPKRLAAACAGGARRGSSPRRPSGTGGATLFTSA